MAVPASRHVLGRLLEEVDHVIIDSDGVLWRGDQAIPGAAEAVAHLARSKMVTLVTNDSKRSRRMYAKKCKALGFDALADDDGAHIVTSAVVVADYAARQLRSIGIQLIGSAGLAEELVRHGVPIRWDKSGNGHVECIDADGRKKREDIDVDTVVVGYCDRFNYEMLNDAYEQIRFNGCHFLATNDDSHYLAAGGRMSPDTGCIVAAVAAAAARSPLVVGMPYAPMFNYLCNNICGSNIRPDPRRILVIGDSQEVEVAFANAHGMPSLCVLTGSVMEQALRNTFDPQLIPTYYTNSIVDLLSL